MNDARCGVGELFHDWEPCGCRPLAESAPVLSEPPLESYPEFDRLEEQGILLGPGNYTAMLAVLRMFERDRIDAQLIQDARGREIAPELVALHGTKTAVKAAADQAKIDTELRRLQERTTFDSIIDAEKIRLTARMAGESDSFIDACLAQRYRQFADVYAGNRGAEARAALQNAIGCYAMKLEME